MDAQACWVFALSKNPRCDAHPSGCGVKRSMLGFCPKQKPKMQASPYGFASLSRACAVPQGNGIERGYSMYPLSTTGPTRLRMRSEACGKWNGPVGTSRGELSAASEVASFEGGDIKYPPSKLATSVFAKPKTELAPQPTGTFCKNPTCLRIPLG
jgi:hypothetical protein